jgi:hypothetical protein
MPSAESRLARATVSGRISTCFIVRDANGHALAYVYFRGRAGTAIGGAPDDPRRGAAIAVNIAKLPELLQLLESQAR